MESRVEKIVYSRELETGKNLLIRKLKECNRIIEENQANCDHIGVYLGERTCEGQANSSVAYCLLCGKKLENKDLVAGKYIDGSMYLEEYDVNSEAQCADRFDTIRTIASGIIGFDSNITNEQLVEAFNDFRNQRIKYQQDNSKPVQKKIEM